MHIQPLDIQASGDPSSSTISRLLQGLWVPLLLLIGVAALLRIVFYTGYFGSDEVTYTEAAYRLLDGDWTVPSYVGGNRYGINLPVAGFTYIFGRSEFAANLYSFFCSLAEVAVIFYVGRSMFGLRAGVLAALFLALLPLHAHFAGRLMADPPLALAITASFALFWLGENKARRFCFMLAGLAAGMVFWIKPHTIIYLAVFLSYPLLFRTWNWNWCWMMGGFLLMVCANSAFFWATTGNPMFLLEIIVSSSTPEIFEAAAAASSIRYAGPEYYFRYLFLNIYHSWILAYMAVAALMFWFVRRKSVAAHEDVGLAFVTWWAFGLISVFSLFPISFNPLILIPKQPNYMLMFVAPLALLAGYTLAQFKGWVFWVLVGAVFVPSFILIGMQQNVIHKFTANSKAAVSFSLAHPGGVLFGSTNAVRASRFYNLTTPDAPNARIEPLANLFDPEHADYYVNASSHIRYAVIDTETRVQREVSSIRNPDNIPSCWVPIESLEPSGFGIGLHVVKSLQSVATAFPGQVGSKLAQTVGATIEPKPAHVFMIPNEGCLNIDY